MGASPGVPIISSPRIIKSWRIVSKMAVYSIIGEPGHRDKTLKIITKETCHEQKTCILVASYGPWRFVSITTRC